MHGQLRAGRLVMGDGEALLASSHTYVLEEHGSFTVIITVHF